MNLFTEIQLQRAKGQLGYKIKIGKLIKNLKFEFYD